MHDWLTVTNALLAMVVGLVAWIGKGFDKRLTKFEATFAEKMEHQAVLLERGTRHEMAISELQHAVSELQVNLARWGGH